MRIVRIVRVVGFYLRNLVQANLLIAREVATRRSGTSPAVVRVPVPDRSVAQVVALANLISLTPGTLTIDVSDDHDAIYVHALHVSEADALRAHIHELDRRLREAFW